MLMGWTHWDLVAFQFSSDALRPPVYLNVSVEGEMVKCPDRVRIGRRDTFMILPLARDVVSDLDLRAQEAQPCTRSQESF